MPKIIISQSGVRPPPFCSVTLHTPHPCLEKIKRLKDAFDNITKGNGVKNENIGKFIFDATKATPTKNIDYYTNESSDYYKDIKKLF